MSRRFMCGSSRKKIKKKKLVGEGLTRPKKEQDFEIEKKVLTLGNEKTFKTPSKCKKPRDSSIKDAFNEWKKCKGDKTCKKNVNLKIQKRLALYRGCDLIKKEKEK